MPALGHSVRVGQPVYYFPLPDPAAKLTELRIHGVSGPDPANILETAAVFHVAGDSITGFARRRAGDRYGPTDVDPASPRQLEAFSWRGVSSGARSRAVWLLLAPFAFINFAAWMHPMVGEPQHSGVPRRDPWNARSVQVFHALLRALGVCFSAQFALTTMAALMLVPKNPDCSSAASKSSYCATFPRYGSALLTATTAGAIGVLAVIVLLAHATLRRYDTLENPAHSGGAGTPSSALGLPTFWGKKTSVTRQFWLHVFVFAAAVGYVIAQMFSTHPYAFRLCCLVVAIGTLVASMSPTFAMQRDLLGPAADQPVSSVPEATPAPADGILQAVSALRRAAFFIGTLSFLGGLAVVGLLLWHGWGGAAGSSVAVPPAQPAGDRFGLADAMTVVVSAELLLLCGLVATIMWMLTRKRPNNVHHRNMLGGNAGWIVPLIGWLVAAFLTSGVLAFAGKIFKNQSHLKVPGFSALVNTGAYAFPVGVLTTLLFAVGRVVWCTIFLDPANLDARIRHPERRGSYRVACGIAYAARTAYWVFVPLAAAAAGWIVWAAIALASATWPGTFTSWPRYLKVPPSAPAMLSIFAFLVGVVPLAVIALAKKVGTQRGVGVLWDVVTFWPRAAHPFAPPCYAERVIPQLRSRHAALTDGGRSVLLSAHSQGSVISAALVLQLQQSDVDNTALLTYGCQYSYLFARGFPAYLGGHVIDELAHRLGLDERHTSRWINLYRLTDYLGSTVHLSSTFVDVNREVADPTYARNSGAGPTTSLQRRDAHGTVDEAADDLPGDSITSEAPLRHSDYPATYEYKQAIAQLDIALLLD